MSRPKSSDIWIVYSAQQLNDGFSNVGRVKEFTSHEVLQNWILKQGDTNKTYLVEHKTNGKRDQPQTGVVYVEQWTAFTGCLCAHTNHGPYSPWVRYDFHNDDEFKNRGQHPKPSKRERRPKLIDEFEFVYRVVSKPEPKIKEAWDLYDDFSHDAKHIQRFSRHDQMEKWIRLNGDTKKTYRAQHIVNDKLQRFDEDWPVHPNLMMPFIEQWQFFGDCRHGWVRYDFRIRDEFDMAMEWGKYGKVPNEEKGSDSKERDACIAKYREMDIPFDKMPPFVRGPWIDGLPVINSGPNEFGFDEREEYLRQQKWEAYGRPIAYNSGPPDLNQLDGNDPSVHNQTKMEQLSGRDPKWPRLIDDKLRDELNKSCSYIPSPKSKPAELPSSSETKEITPKQKPNPKIKPSITRWKTATGYLLAVENNLTGQLGEKEIKDGWELCTDRYDQVLLSQTREEQKTWLMANGRRGHVYNSKHFVDGQNMPCDAGYWYYTDADDRFFSWKCEWKFKQRCSETKDKDSHEISRTDMRN